MRHVCVFVWTGSSWLAGFRLHFKWFGSSSKQWIGTRGQPSRGEEEEWNCCSDLEGKCLSVSRRPFPPGDRVTFNGRDCLCQLCAQPMSSSPKEASCSGSKCPSHLLTWIPSFLKGSLGRYLPFWETLVAGAKRRPISKAFSIVKRDAWRSLH